MTLFPLKYTYSLYSPNYFYLGRINKLSLLAISPNQSTTINNIIITATIIYLSHPNHNLIYSL
jgi:hypothetical protein